MSRHIEVYEHGSCGVSYIQGTIEPNEQELSDIIRAEKRLVGLT